MIVPVLYESWLLTFNERPIERELKNIILVSGYTILGAARANFTLKTVSNKKRDEVLVPHDQSSFATSTKSGWFLTGNPIRTSTVSMVCHPCKVGAGNITEEAYGRRLTGEGRSYAERQREPVECLECGEHLAVGSMSIHMMTQHGKAAGQRRLWIP